MTHHLKQNRKLKLIGWLMLASEILLFLFIFQWIRTQYQESTNRLTTDIQLLFTKAENDIRDSLLNRQVTAVMQKDLGIGTLLPLKMSSKDSSLTKVPGASRKSIHLFSKPPGTATVIHQNDTSAPGTIILSPGTAPDDREKTDKILRMALQEIINNIDATALNVQTDTSWLRKEFSQAVAQRFQGIRVVWTQPGKASPAFCYPAGAVQPGSPCLSLEGHRFYLFKKVLPQVMFCLVLLVISSLAFLLAYLNTRRQNLFAQQKDDFISNISHELKTPVATAKIAIEALSSYDAMEDQERAKRYLGMASWEINRLETMISKIMDTTQADHGVLVLDKQKIHLPGLVQEITDSLQQVLMQGKIILQLNVQAKNAHVLGDHTHLTGAIYNLVDNAVKYGRDLIRIDIYRNHRNLYLKIADNGPGIPETYREKIFEKFVRVPQENIHNVKGYGLGLSYARYIIESHQGSLQLEQATGWGAVFRICLPEFPAEDEV